MWITRDLPIGTHLFILGGRTEVCTVHKPTYEGTRRYVTVRIEAVGPTSKFHIGDVVRLRTNYLYNEQRRKRGGPY